MGLTFTCGGGIHMFTLFNKSAPSWNLFLLTLLEVTATSWLYGADRLLRNLDEMNQTLHPVLKMYWKLCWTLVTPLILAALLVMSLANFGNVSYGGYVYPLGIQVLGYLITGCTLVWIPIFGAIEWVKNGPSGDKRKLMHPTSDWTRQSYGSCGN